MKTTDDLASLQARVEELEAQNRALRSTAEAHPAVEGRSKGRGRAALAVVLILIATLLAPVAVIGGWARAQLVDTDRFVQTFAPLAQKPDMQAFVTDQAVQAIDDNVDIEALVGEVFAGIDSLNLPPRSSAALGMLQGPAVEGVRSMIRTGVDRVVTSPQFAQLWESVLRETHGRAIAVIQGDPNAALQLSDDGTLSLQLGTLIREVKQALVGQGMGFAERIPEIDRAIPLLASDSFVLIRTIYQLSVVVGYWLPWVTLGLLVLGVAVARNRLRTVAWAGFALAASFLLLAGGLGAGRLFFVGSVSPSIMPAGTAEALFEQLTELMFSTIVALVVMSALIALCAWIFGRSRPAVAVRTAGDRAFGSLRAASDRVGLDPKGFGRAVERWRPAILVAAAAIGVLVLFLQRPVTVGGVIGTLVVLAVVLLLVELLRRPARPDAENAEKAETDGADAERNTVEAG